MSIKRFVAPTMRRALDLVRMEMGPDAIILSSQKVKEGVEVITSTEIDVATRGAHAAKEFSRGFDLDVDTPLASDQAWHVQQGIESAAKQYVRPTLVNPLQEKSQTQQNASSISSTRSNELAKEIEAARERMIQAKKGQKLKPQPRQHEYVDTEVQPPALPEPVFQYPKEKIHIQTATSNVDRQMAGLHEQVKHLTSVLPEENEDHSKSNAQLAMMQSEIADMRMLLEQQMMRGQETQVHNLFSSPVSEALYGHISALGLPQAIVRNLADAVGTRKPLNVSWREALARLSKQIKVNNSVDINKGGVFAFVGATGVGKTTTIAKLAAKYVLEHGMGKVALITTDTYRVGAHDQLRSLGRILNVPVRVVDQERSLASVVASLKSFPLVLIDTAGFRQGDPLLNQQEHMLASCPMLHRILVLACNAQVQTLKATAHAFNRTPLVGCILTKLDECFSLGEMLGVLIQHQLPVMYAADGQSIPEDLDKASAPNLVAKAVALMKGQQLQPKVAVGHP